MYLKEDADSQVHEGLGKVDDALPGVVDGHSADGQVRFLRMHRVVVKRRRGQRWGRGGGVARGGPTRHERKENVRVIPCP